MTHGAPLQAFKVPALEHSHERLQQLTKDVGLRDALLAFPFSPAADDSPTPEHRPGTSNLHPWISQPLYVTKEIDQTTNTPLAKPSTSLSVPAKLGIVTVKVARATAVWLSARPIRPQQCACARLV